MSTWLTTILIFLPVAGGLLVAAAPLPRVWLGSLASLISLLEVGFWITAASKFDFGDASLQFDQRYSWFSADPIPNAKLINSDGSPTALGQVYISLASSCP